jgi:hypothetical protein
MNKGKWSVCAGMRAMKKPIESQPRTSKIPVRKSKKLFYVITLLVLVGLGGFLFFQLKPNVQPENTKNPIFEQYLSSAKRIQSIELEYESTLTLTSNSNVTTVEISGKTYRKGNNRFDEAVVRAGDKIANVRTYIFNDKVYVCPNIEGKWQCNQVETIVSLSNEASLRTLENMYGKGAMVFVEPAGRTAGARTIDGKTCNQLSINVDMSKLSKEEKYFILAISGLSTVKDPDKYADLIDSFSMNLCVAEGVELESEYVLNIGKTNTYKVHTTIKSYEINKEIPDSLFILPSEPEISANEIEYEKEGKTYRGAYFPEHETALNWIRANTPETAKFFSWWDYGHEIMGYAKRGVHVFSPSKEILWSVAGGWDEYVNGPLSPHEKIISIVHGFLTESFGELRDEMEKCNTQYIFITSNYFEELKVMLKIGQEFGKINPEEYIVDGNPTQKAKRTTLYTLWNKPPGYEELIRPFALVYEDAYVKIYKLG